MWKETLTLQETPVQQLNHLLLITIISEPSILKSNLDKLNRFVVNFDDDGNVTFQDLDKVEANDYIVSITTEDTKTYNTDDNDSDYGGDIKTEGESESSEDEKKTEVMQKGTKDGFW